MTNITQTHKDVVKSPKDTVLNNAKVTRAEKTTWRNIIPEDKISKFSEPDKEIIRVQFEVEFEGTTLKGEDTMAYFDKPFSNSKMGKYLEKYGNFEEGQTVVIDYDENGFASLRLPK